MIWLTSCKSATSESPLPSSPASDGAEHTDENARDEAACKAEDVPVASENASAASSSGRRIRLAAHDE